MIFEASNFLSRLGIYIKDNIIYIAEILTKSEGSPGIVALLFLIALILAGILYYIQTRAQLRAVRDMDSIVKSYAGIPEFAENFTEFRRQLAEKKGKSKAWNVLWEAWDEFSETIVTDDIEGPVTQRNSIRPASFMNIEDLGFDSGFFKILPNIFVSLGLFLTFLGLVAALHQFASAMGGAGGDSNMESAMTGFMTIASAKFTMSLYSESRISRI